MNIKSIILGVLIVLVVIFVIQNTQVVGVQLFFWKISMSRALMLFGTLFIGVMHSRGMPWR